MRSLAAALLSIAVCVPMVLGDMGYIPDPSDRRAYDWTASIALAWAMVVIWRGDDR